MLKKTKEIEGITAEINEEKERELKVTRRSLLQGAVTLGVAAAGGVALNLSAPSAAEAMAQIGRAHV